MKHLPIIAILCAAAVLAMAEEWRDYPLLPSPPPPENLLVNGDFEAGLNGWTVANGFTAAAEGRGGGGAARYDRGDPGAYQVLTQPLVGVEADTVYTLSGAAAMSAPDIDACIYVEAYRLSDGKYHHGHYVSSRALADWNPLEIRFNSGTDAGEYRWIAGMYLGRGQTGTVLFDELSVVRNNPEWHAAQLFPIGETVYTDDPRIEVASSVSGEFVYRRDFPPQLCVAAEAADLPEASPAAVENDRAVLRFGALAEGERQLKLTLFDRANRIRLAETEVPLRIRRRLAAGVTVDACGRTLVDGEPFMPLGLYVNYPLQQELERFRGTPFNTIMPYASVRMRPDGGGDLASADLKDIRTVLDWWHQAGFKVIFSLKDLYPAGVVSTPYLPWRDLSDGDEVARLMVEAFRDHPALLAWYICDEMSVRNKEYLIARRRLVNALDPGHPAWAVFMETEIIEPTRGGYDILGLDPYPIRSDAPDNMRIIAEFMEAARERMAFNGGRMSMWTVPQVFGYRAYGRETGRTPTADEMIAMTLLEAIYGAKGFIFYAYMDIGRSGVPFEEHWARVLELGTVMKSLEAFILSVEDAPAMTLDVLTGDVRGRAFQSGGASCLLLTGVGPGPAAARITAAPGLQSHTGATVETEPGVYDFSGRDICYDILRSR